MSKIIELTYFASVNNGILKIKDRKGFDKYICQFEGKEVTVDVKRKRSKRSLEQNAFFHSWVGLLSDYTGYTKTEMKDIIKNQFLKCESVNEKTGSIFTYTKDTSSLNKTEFADFCTDIQHWSESEFNVRLPLPNEQWELTIN